MIGPATAVHSSADAAGTWHLPNPGKRDALDHGKLFVCLLRKKGRWGFFAAATRALLGLARKDDMIRIDAVERVRVESQRSHLTVSIDGETWQLQPPLEYKIRHAALRVMAPALVAEGRRYRWIARDLSLSKNTVAAIVGRARVETAPDIQLAG